jgi:hypothetical protein
MSVRSLLVSVLALSVVAVLGIRDASGDGERVANWKSWSTTVPFAGEKRWVGWTPPAGR